MKQDIQQVEQEIAFMEKYYANYLDSEYAPYFRGHENGILYSREFIVRLKNKQNIPTETSLRATIDDDEKIILSTPQESWHYFIDEKLRFLKERGILE